jgi:hypothetical protein
MALILQGLRNFKKDLSIMLGPKITNNVLFYFWFVCWAIVCPVLLVVSDFVTFESNEILISLFLSC